MTTYATRFNLSRAGRQGGAQLGCDPRAWVRSFEIVNASTMPENAPDGELVGILPPGSVQLMCSAVVIPADAFEPLPDTMDARAANGHVMTYRVTGRDKETGRLTYSQWDAWHSDACPCVTSGDYEPMGDY